MRNTFLLGLVALLSFISCNQPNNTKTDNKDSVANTSTINVAASNEVQHAINTFVQAYEHRNNIAINRLIHPDLGLTIIYRPGVSDTFTKIETFDFKKPMPEYYAYPEAKNKYSLAFAKLPEYDCGTEKWSKIGLYCDTIAQPNQLSQIVTFENEFEPHKYTKEQINWIQQSEKDSYRVILTGENPLVFHLQKYNDKWYVTVLDRAYAGCDA